MSTSRVSLSSRTSQHTVKSSRSSNFHPERVIIAVALTLLFLLISTFVFCYVRWRRQRRRQQQQRALEWRYKARQSQNRALRIKEKLESSIAVKRPAPVARIVCGYEYLCTWGAERGSSPRTVDGGAIAGSEIAHQEEGLCIQEFREFPPSYAQAVA